MKIWCVQLKRRFGTTDDSPLRHFPCIFLKFHGHFFTKLCLEVKEAVTTCFASQAAPFYGEGIQKLVQRYDK
jgi:hypothetical protein